MTKIAFSPYVGPKFASATTRLLIIGESHYGEPTENPKESTRHVVEMWADGKWGIRYLTVAARILTGLPRHLVNKQSVIEGITFYNYVQFMMQEIGTRPTQTQIFASSEAFE